MVRVGGMLNWSGRNSAALWSSRVCTGPNKGRHLMARTPVFRRQQLRESVGDCHTRGEVIAPEAVRSTVQLRSSGKGLLLTTVTI